MTADMTARVTLVAVPAVLAAAGVAGGIGGLTAATGVAAGGAVALVNFHWLARGARRALGAGRGGWFALAGVGLRYPGAFVALALVVATGWAHPLGVVAGLAILPPVLILQGLRT
jgi:hypothetical protein